MQRLFNKLDLALDVLVPISLIVVTIPLVFPSIQRIIDALSVDIDLLPKFFDKPQRAFFLVPIALYSIGLMIKHIRAFPHQTNPSLGWIITLLGAETGFIISCIIYFSGRIDVFLLNLPSFWAYFSIMYINHLKDVGQTPSTKALFTFVSNEARLVLNGVALFIAILLPLATDVKVKLTNSDMEFISKQMTELTKKHVKIYQHQDKCFSNQITYYTNIVAQSLVADQEYDQKCALATITSTILTSGNQRDVAILATAISYLSTAVPAYGKVTKQISEFLGTAKENDKLCSDYGETRYCLIRER